MNNQRHQKKAISVNPIKQEIMETELDVKIAGAKVNKKQMLSSQKKIKSLIWQKLKIFVTWLVDRFIEKNFYGLTVSGLEKATRLSFQGYHLIFIPTCRSKLDLIVLHYIFRKHGFREPLALVNFPSGSFFRRLVLERLGVISPKKGQQQLTSREIHHLLLKAIRQKRPLVILTTRFPDYGTFLTPSRIFPAIYSKIIETSEGAPTAFIPLSMGYDKLLEKKIVKRSLKISLGVFTNRMNAMVIQMWNKFQSIETTLRLRDLAFNRGSLGMVNVWVSEPLLYNQNLLKEQRQATDFKRNLRQITNKAYLLETPASAMQIVSALVLGSYNSRFSSISAIDLLRAGDHLGKLLNPSFSRGEIRDAVVRAESLGLIKIEKGIIFPKNDYALTQLHYHKRLVLPKLTLVSILFKEIIDHQFELPSPTQCTLKFQLRFQNITLSNSQIPIAIHTLIQRMLNSQLAEIHDNKVFIHHDMQRALPIILPCQEL